MTRIDFYLLPDQQPLARLRFACRIAEKAYALGHRVHIHTGSPQATAHMDELLWTFRDGSFIPHDVAGAQDAHGDGPCPVTLGHDWEPPAASDVLINLAQDVPVFFSRFERVAEILDETPETVAQGRERYRFYRDRGYNLEHHKIDPA